MPIKFASSHKSLGEGQPTMSQLGALCQVMSQQQQQQQQPVAFASLVNDLYQQPFNGQHQTLSHQPDPRHQTHEQCLYSPSSSTSLLYHIYDQIQLPATETSSSPANNKLNSHLLHLQLNQHHDTLHPQPIVYGRQPRQPSTLAGLHMPTNSGLASEKPTLYPELRQPSIGRRVQQLVLSHKTQVNCAVLLTLLALTLTLVIKLSFAPQAQEPTTRHHSYSHQQQAPGSSYQRSHRHHQPETDLNQASQLAPTAIQSSEQSIYSSNSNWQPSSSRQGQQASSELPPVELPSGWPAFETEPHEEQANADLFANSVVWSEWSQWSPCFDKNGICDETRIHSRLRKCVSQLTGERVEASQCRQRFGGQDLELEVANCAASCRQQEEQSPADSPAMSDAPSFNGPQTAPSVMLGGLSLGSRLSLGDLIVGSGTGGSSTERSADSGPSVAILEQPVQLQQQQQQQVSCSNCTSGEICLMLMQQKVPFCAKIKDPSDESGCGGWCKAQNQLCQAAGQNAFKCIHDSECLADEWRCHDMGCIPLSKRCDGHSNCYDSSDERDCPINNIN